MQAAGNQPMARKITISLSQQQLQDLIQLTYLGSFMKGIYNQAPWAIEKIPVVQTIYRAACKAGLNERVQYEDKSKEYSTTRKFKLSQLDGKISEYNNNTFLEQLSTLLTEKEMEKKYGALELEKMKAEHRMPETIHLHLDYEEKINRNLDGLLDHVLKFFEAEQKGCEEASGASQ